MPTDDGLLQQLRSVLHLHLAPRRHSALLVAIVTAFAVRPLIGNGGIAPAAFSIVLLVTLLFALYAIQLDELVGAPETLSWRKGGGAASLAARSQYLRLRNVWPSFSCQALYSTFRPRN